MTEAICYVEGAGDKVAMEALLRPLLDQKRSQGVAVNFFETPAGDRKKSILLKGPDKALGILRSRPLAQVALIPDLYPKNKGFPHETVADLRSGIFDAARRIIERKSLDLGLLERLHVFCFKHDLEALVLAADEALATRLGVRRLKPSWIIPVEDQNLDRPPKTVVEELFRQHQKSYQVTVDAPVILSTVPYLELADSCPQCFAPLVRWIEGL